jgi:hypothetical protein
MEDHPVGFRCRASGEKQYQQSAGDKSPETPAYREFF